jgi:hybrid cluster-associated redox disulfide protein
MEATLDSTWTVEQVMKVHPNAVAVFLALKTNCVGCLLGKFCRLEDVANVYEIPLEVLLTRLCESANVQNQTRRKA